MLMAMQSTLLRLVTGGNYHDGSLRQNWRILQIENCRILTTQTYIQRYFGVSFSLL